MPKAGQFGCKLKTGQMLAFCKSGFVPGAIIREIPPDWFLIDYFNCPGWEADKLLPALNLE